MEKKKELILEMERIVALNPFFGYLFRFLRNKWMVIEDHLSKDEIVMGFIPAYHKRFRGLGILVITNQRFLFMKRKIKFEIPIHRFDTYFYERERATLHIKLGKKNHAFWLFDDKAARHFLQRIHQVKKRSKRGEPGVSALENVACRPASDNRNL